MATRLSTILHADLFRYRGQTSRAAFWSAWLHEPGFRFTYHLRNVAYYRDRKKSLAIFPYIVHRILWNHYRFRYGFDISPAASIGTGLYLGHFGGVVISPYATLGSNINIAHGVTIGSESRGRRAGTPTLEDRVWVGAHAIIVGKITIGADALIAPGAFVNFDVPPRSVVLGNPGKIVAHTGSAGYINNTMPVSGFSPPPGLHEPSASDPLAGATRPSRERESVYNRYIPYNPEVDA